MKRDKVVAPVLRTLVLSCAVLAATSSIALAQRGGGGGGAGGGRGGGRGGGGFGSAESPIDRVKAQLKETDQLEFLDKKKKQLELTKEQKNSIKSLHKEMDDMQKPIFKDLEQIFAQSGGRGGARGGGGGVDGGGAGGRGAMPAGVQAAMLRLSEIQDAAGERAHAMLNDTQKHMSDSLMVIYKADIRDKEAKRSRATGARRGG